MDKDQSDENQKKKRRKRTDQDGRNYTCECGKSYLSYPALYTHIKTKHYSKLDEFAPNRFAKDQEQDPSSAPQKSEEMKNTIKDQEKQDEQIQCNNNQPVFGITGTSSDTSIIAAFKQLLFLYFPNPQAKISTKDKKVLFSDQQKKFLRQSKQYWNGKRKEEQKANNEGIIQVSMQIAFGKFIYEFDKDIGSPLRKYIYLFFLKIRKYIEEVKGKGYCKENCVSELPGMFNQIIIKFLGEEDQHLSNPSLIAKSMYFFARWLYAVKCTNLSLKYNF